MVVDSLNDLQRPRGSTCSLNYMVHIHSESQYSFWLSRNAGAQTQAEKRSRNSQTLKFRSQMTWHQKGSSHGDKAADIWFNNFHI